MVVLLLLLLVVVVVVLLLLVVLLLVVVVVVVLLLPLVVPHCFDAVVWQTLAPLGVLGVRMVAGRPLQVLGV
jgi:hypothetical protein